MRYETKIQGVTDADELTAPTIPADRLPDFLELVRMTIDGDTKGRGIAAFRDLPQVVFKGRRFGRSAVVAMGTSDDNAHGGTIYIEAVAFVLSGDAVTDGLAIEWGKKPSEAMGLTADKIDDWAKSDPKPFLLTVIAGPNVYQDLPAEAVAYALGTVMDTAI